MGDGLWADAYGLSADWLIDGGFMPQIWAELQWHWA